MGYAHSQIRGSRTKLKKWHIDIYAKTKNGATHAVKYWLNPVQHLF